MLGTGFEPVHLSICELESHPLDHSGNLAGTHVHHTNPQPTYSQQVYTHQKKHNLTVSHNIHYKLSDKPHTTIRNCTPETYQGSSSTNHASNITADAVNMNNHSRYARTIWYVD